MIVLLPVSAFRIEYEVGQGRPFSGLEALVLRAIGEGTTTLPQLEKVFRISPRLLVEALVTLTHAGWIAIGAPAQADFILTAEGKAASESGEAPRSFATADRGSQVVMERVTGALVPGRDVRFATRGELEKVWSRCVRLPIDVVDNGLDEGQVQGLLPLARGEWLRWVESVEMITKGGSWLPVTVNTESGVVLGLPAAWERRLRAEVVERARAKAGALPLEAAGLAWRTYAPRLERSDSGAPRVPDEWYPIRLVQEHLVLSRAAHIALLVRAFEKVSTQIVVASAFMTQDALEELRPHLMSALQRNVSVDLLWGYAAEDGSAVEKLRKMVREIRKSGVPGKVHFNATPSGSHAKLLVWDEGATVKCCLGSFNWLSTFGTTDQLAHDASIVLEEPHLASRICRCVAAFWNAIETEALTTTRDRWLRLALELDQSTAVAAPEGACRAKLLIDREIDGWFREALLEARTRLLVTSHRLGRAAPVRTQRAVGRERAPEFELRVYYGRADEAETIEQARAAISEAHGTLVNSPSVHAKVAVRDHEVCVGSYNFLAADPFGKAKGGRELALVIDDRAIADALADTIKSWEP